MCMVRRTLNNLSPNTCSYQTFLLLPSFWAQKTREKTEPRWKRAAPKMEILQSQRVELMVGVAVALVAIGAGTAYYFHLSNKKPKGSFSHFSTSPLYGFFCYQFLWPITIETFILLGFPCFRVYKSITLLRCLLWFECVFLGGWFLDSLEFTNGGWIFVLNANCWQRAGRLNSCGFPHCVNGAYPFLLV